MLLVPDRWTPSTGDMQILIRVIGGKACSWQTCGTKKISPFQFLLDWPLSLPALCRRNLTGPCLEALDSSPAVELAPHLMCMQLRKHPGSIHVRPFRHSTSLCSLDQSLPVFSAACSLIGAVDRTLPWEHNASQLSHHQGLLGSQWSWGQPGRCCVCVTLGWCWTVLLQLVPACVPQFLSAEVDGVYAL